MDSITDVVGSLVNKANEIERQKDRKALTQDEVDTLKSADFLRKIAPYLFPSGGK